MRSYILSAAVALATMQLSTAQTYTSCNPTEKTCPSDSALGTTITVDFTKGNNSAFTADEGTTLTYGSNGAEFIINSETQAPTIESNWYIFFGTVEVVMQAAPGVGIVSSFVLESDDLDEIDWEWLGGDLTQVESNYFGKGNTTTYDRAIYHPVASPQTSFHTYTIDWSSSAIKWSIDGTVVRTLNYADANGGSNFPQTPMKVKMGNWVGGSSTSPEGTVEWAGGLADFSNAPFTMYVKSVTITDASTGASSYTYGDLTGSYESIQVAKGGSFVAESSGSAVASVTSTSSTAATSSSTVSTSTVTSSVSIKSSTLVTSIAKTTAGTTVVPLSTAASATTRASNSTVKTPSATSSATVTSATPAKVTTTSGASRYGVTEGSAIALVLALGYLLL